MRRVALRGLLGRKLRTILTALAIVIGVSMVSGTFVLTDTIDRAFHAIFAASYAQTDAVVSGKKLVDWSTSGNATVSPVAARKDSERCPTCGGRRRDPRLLQRQRHGAA